MPIATDPPSEIAPLPAFPQPVINKVYKPEYRGSVVDTKVEPIAGLLTHISGASWVVDYYGQAIGADEELTGYQPGQLPVYQQYIKVIGLELKVQTPLSQSQDPQATSFVVTGASMMYPGIIPNEGDIFFADVGDGRTGQFTVDGVTRKTILKQSCYEIEYSLTRYVDQQLFDDIDARVIQKYRFSKDFLSYGQNPIITDSSFRIKEKLQEVRKNLLTRYIQWFYSTEYRTILIPGQGTPAYDPFVVKTWLRLFDKSESTMLQKIRELNVDGLTDMRLVNFWDVLLTLDKDLLCCTGALKMYVLPHTAFTSWPFYDGIYHSGVKQIVVPLAESNGVDDDYPVPCSGSCTCEPGGGDLVPLDDMDWDLRSLFPLTYLNGLDDIYGPLGPPEPTDPVWIHPVLIDEYYVLSDAFYKREELGQSKLELMVNQMLDKETINSGQFLALVDSMCQWGRLEKFYYTPILIVLANAVLRSL